MHVVPHPNEGKKVWLDEQEVKAFLDEAENTEQDIAFSLGVRSGLRVAEIIAVRPKDVVSTSTGPRVIVRQGKGAKYRETPCTPDLYRTANVMVDIGARESDETMIETEHTRTVRQWVYNAATRLAERMGDDRWEFLGPHDLRRTWATQMVGKYKVDPLLVCDFGGWEDLQTFLEHYRGIYSPEVQRRELAKVDWLDTESNVSHDREPQTVLLESEG